MHIQLNWKLETVSGLLQQNKSASHDEIAAILIHGIEQVFVCFSNWSFLSPIIIIISHHLLSSLLLFTSSFPFYTCLCSLFIAYCCLFADAHPFVICKTVRNANRHFQFRFLCKCTNTTANERKNNNKEKFFYLLAIVFMARFELNKIESDTKIQSGCRYNCVHSP